jgi:hypothetical protein
MRRDRVAFYACLDPLCLSPARFGGAFCWGNKGGLCGVGRQMTDGALPATPSHPAREITGPYALRASPRVCCATAAVWTSASVTGTRKPARNDVMLVNHLPVPAGRGQLDRTRYSRMPAAMARSPGCIPLQRIAVAVSPAVASFPERLAGRRLVSGQNLRIE